jgi:hypothetical protein
MGFNSNHHATIACDGGGTLFAVHTRENGTNYNNTIVARQGNVGIGVTDPGENLVVGHNIGSYGGNRVVIGDVNPGVGTGLVIGEDSNNRSWILWDTDDNTLSIGSKEAGVNQGNAITIGDGTVELFDNAISAREILDEPGAQTNHRANAYYIQENWDDFLRITCQFPASGYAMVVGTAQLTFFKGASPQDYQIAFAIADSTGVAPYVYLKDYGNQEWSNSQSILDPVTIHEFYPVEAGSNLFQFMAAGGVSGTAYQVLNARMTVTFFPTSYTAKVSTVSNEETPALSDATVQPVFYRSETPPDHGEESPTEPDRIESLRAEFEAELDALKAEIAELKKVR